MWPQASSSWHRDFQAMMAYVLQTVTTNKCILKLLIVRYFCFNEKNNSHIVLSLFFSYDIFDHVLTLSPSSQFSPFPYSTSLMFFFPFKKPTKTKIKTKTSKTKMPKNQHWELNKSIHYLSIQLIKTYLLLNYSNGFLPKQQSTLNFQQL